MTRAVGILGGTFDPIHYGHLRSALEVLQQATLNEVRFVPTYQSPLRNSTHVDALHRLKMTELATANTPEFLVDAYEIQQQQTTYTIDTLSHLRTVYNKKTAIGFMIGADAFSQIDKWQRYCELLELCHLIVLQRPNHLISTETPVKIWEDRVKCVDSKFSLAEFGPYGNIFMLKTTQLAISASQIRTFIQHQQSPQFLLPDVVWNYIQANQLYH